MAKDPVCGITLDNRAPCKSTHAGHVHVFCCLTCKTEFDKEPGRYVTAPRVAPMFQRPPSGPRGLAFLDHFIHRAPPSGRSPQISVQ
jgi:YHS domain-containing protein